MQEGRICSFVLFLVLCSNGGTDVVEGGYVSKTRMQECRICILVNLQDEAISYTNFFCI